MTDWQTEVAKLTEVASGNHRLLAGLAWRAMSMSGLRPKQEDLEDAISDAYLAAASRLRAGEAIRDMGPWFKRVLFFTCLAQARKYYRRKETALDELTDELLADDRAIDALDRMVDARRLLADLPEADRLLIAAVLEGRTSSEIGEQLGIPADTARQRKHRILARLLQDTEGETRDQADHRHRGASAAP